jgi:predicted DNA-binding transcriptional regulator AlpA
MPSDVQALIDLLLARQHVEQMLGTDYAGIWRLIRSEGFPVPTLIPRKRGRKSYVCWERAPVMAWLAQHRPQASRPILRRPTQ